MRFCFLNFIGVFFLFSGCFTMIYAQSDAYNFPEWTSEELRVARTTGSADYLTQAEKEVIFLVNLARTQPRKFADTYLTRYVENNSPQYTETDGYVVSLRKTLYKMTPVAALIPNAALFKATVFHADDNGKQGVIGHNDSNGGSMESRFYRFIPKSQYKTFGENCQYGFNDPIDIVMDLLIDQGIPDLGHRINMLEPSFAYTAVAMRPHRKYKICTIQDFATFHEK